MEVSIVGYGNIGKALEQIVSTENNLQLKSIYSRRHIQHKLYLPFDDIDNASENTTLLVAQRSHEELTDNAKLFAKFNTVDCFDEHENIDEYKEMLGNNKLHLICCGWDPGIFSMARCMFGIVSCDMATLWGKGISAGHSTAIRQIDGVIDAVSFTEPSKETLQNLENGNYNNITHNRICYIACASAYKEEITNKVVSHPLFKNSHTEITFVTPQEVRKLRGTFAHKGTVVAADNNTMLTMKLSTNCNPTLTAQIMIAYAKLVERLLTDGYKGVISPLDIPLRYFDNGKML